MMKALYRIMNSGSTLGSLMQVVPITLLVGILYAACRCIRHAKRGSSICWGTEIIRWLFVCYLTGLVNLILVPANFWMTIWANLCLGYSHSEIVLFSGEFNLMPTLIKWLMGELTIGHWVLQMLVYNFLMFVPFGCFLPFVSEKVNHRSIWVIAVIVPLAVELLQPVIGRSFDTDDLLLNFAGIVVGYLAATLIRTIHRKPATR